MPENTKVFIDDVVFTHSWKTIKKDIDDAIGNHALTVFSATYCPYCRRAKDLLAQWEPHIVEVDKIGDKTTTGGESKPDVAVKSDDVKSDDVKADKADKVDKRLDILLINQEQMMNKIL